MPPSRTNARLKPIDLAEMPSPWSGLSRRDQFFEDAALQNLLIRGRSYVEAGVPLNLSGPSGLGKTTMALRIAESMGRPISFMAGNQWLGASDFIGREVGKSTRTIVDKYIQSVHRTDAEERAQWRSAILAEAMRLGHILIYDEFTRASPQANAVLLSVLEEGVLITTDRVSKTSAIEAHPAFRMILTSNPHDYIGVNGAPDALLDRMINLTLAPLSDEAIRGIMMQRSGIKKDRAEQILGLVEKFGHGQGSKLRASLMIARIAAHMGRGKPISDDALGQIAADVLQGRRWNSATVSALPSREAS